MKGCWVLTKQEKRDPEYEKFLREEGKFEFFHNKKVNERLKAVLFSERTSDYQEIFREIALNLAKHGYTVEDINNSDTNDLFKKRFWYYLQEALFKRGIIGENDRKYTLEGS